MKKILLLILASIFALNPIGFCDYNLVFQPAQKASVSTSGYLAENIYYENGTYYWVFTNSNNGDIGMATATSLTGTWTVNTSLINDGGATFYAPYLTKFGSTYYIYYSDTTAKDVYVQTSTTVNSGYGNATLVLANGAGGSWNENRSSECEVHLINGTYYMFFMGENVGSTNEKVGIATSSTPDGTFVEVPGNPLFSGDDQYWNRGTDKAADPEYFYRNGVHYLCMAATRTATKGSTRNTGCYKSTDLTTWNPVPRVALLQDTRSGADDAEGSFRGAFYDEGTSPIWTPYTCQASSSGTYTLCLGRTYLIPES